MRAICTSLSGHTPETSEGVEPVGACQLEGGDGRLHVDGAASSALRAHSACHAAARLNEPHPSPAATPAGCCEPTATTGCVDAAPTLPARAADPHVVRDLLQEDAGAVGQASLPRLAEDRIEGLGPALKGAVKAWGRAAPGTCAQDEPKRAEGATLPIWPAPERTGHAASPALAPLYPARLRSHAPAMKYVTTHLSRSTGSAASAASRRKRGYTCQQMVG